MNKVTKAGVAGLTALVLAGGATAAFANNGSGPDPAKDGKVDVTREHKGYERNHDSAKDQKADRSGKDNYKESWDKKDGAKDNSKDGSKDGSADPSKDLSLR